MSITGCLSDFSLVEIFKFIEQGRKTGRLMICDLSPARECEQKCYYIWVQQGRIVAAANQLDNQGLISLITQLEWVSDRLINKLLQWCCPQGKPLGFWLKKYGLIQNEQLQQLFLIQIFQQLAILLKLRDGQFEFNQNVLLPEREMTGVSLPIGNLNGKFHRKSGSQFHQQEQLDYIFDTSLVEQPLSQSRGRDELVCSCGNI